MIDSEDIVRYQLETLPAYSEAARDVTLLVFPGTQGAWRIVEAISQTGLPFELFLDWTLSGGSDTSARMTISRASRVSVYAKEVTVKVRNLAQRPNSIRSVIADGFQTTSNVLEYRDQCDGTGERSFAVPSFARSVRVELSDLSAAEGALLSLLDANGEVTSITRVLSQPELGVAIGGASSVRLLMTQPAAFRVLFFLSM